LPELPEVETVRRGLTPAMLEQHILAAETRREGLRFPFPANMAERLTGTRVTAIDRRAKYLLVGLDSAQTLIVHLGMSGRMLVSGLPTANFVAVSATPQKHDHVVLTMSGGARITFNDARRFGMMDLWPSADLSRHRLLASLGPEPLGNDFNAPSLARALAGRQTPVKAALLDQTVVAGLGNIYVCEALFRAGIDPRRKSGSIPPDRIDALVLAIRSVLAEAIEAGGSSLRDHRQTNGELGYFQHGFAVYGREGEPCPTPGCQATILRIVQAGRSTFFCPDCQG
jgi:formamidopyrimidine-DNA glycosylase